VPDSSRENPIGLEGFFELAPDFLAILDEKGRLLRVSRGAVNLLGQSAASLGGRAFHDFIHADDREVVEGSLARALSTKGLPLSLQFRLGPVSEGSEDDLGNSAKYRWVEVCFSSGSEEIFQGAILAVARDLTKLMEMEARAEESSREKKDALREIQHRVKNSIALISSFIALEEGKAEQGALRAALESLRFRVDSISALYRLQFASGDSDAIDLGAYIEKIASDISQTIDRAGVDVRLDLEDITFDSKRAIPFGILCTELVANSLRHAFGAADGGFVALTLRQEQDRLRLVVEDDGRGLPEGFSLASQEGLGLQIVKMLASQLRGSFAHCGREGGGARFVVDIPVVARD